MKANIFDVFPQLDLCFPVPLSSTCPATAAGSSDKSRDEFPNERLARNCRRALAGLKPLADEPCCQGVAR